MNTARLIRLLTVALASGTGSWAAGAQAQGSYDPMGLPQMIVKGAKPETKEGSLPARTALQSLTPEGSPTSKENRTVADGISQRDGGLKAEAPPMAEMSAIPAVPPISQADIPVVPPGSQKPISSDDEDAEEEDRPDAERGRIFERDFERAYRNSQPLTPDQILEIRRRQSKIADAKKVPLAVPTPSTVSFSVSTKPGALIQEIVTSYGRTTALTFTDITGKPWPIQSATVGNSAIFTIEVPEKPGNIMQITPTNLSLHGETNLILLMEGMNAPLALTVTTSTERSYYNASLILDERGPNAVEPVAEKPLEPITDPAVRAILDGAGGALPNVEKIEIIGGGEAFRIGHQLFLRTPHRLISPSWLSVVRGNGMNVYEVPAMPTYLVSDESGSKRRLQLSERAILDAVMDRPRLHPNLYPDEVPLHNKAYFEGKP